MSEQEFIDWCDSETWAEWVDGEVIVMSPVNLVHAQISAFFLHLIRMFVEEHDLGEVLTEPYQVRFSRLRRRRSPDILFVGKDRVDRLKMHHVEGAADLIVEVVSPGSQSRDRREKYLEYQAAGVREYWIIDPQSESVEFYTLGPGKKYAPIVEENGAIASVVLPRFVLKPACLWRQKLPKVSDVLREMSSKR